MKRFPRMPGAIAALMFLAMPSCSGGDDAWTEDYDDAQSAKTAANTVCNFCASSIETGNQYTVSIQDKDLKPLKAGAGKSWNVVVSLGGSTRSPAGKIPQSGEMVIDLQPWAAGSGTISVNEVDEKKGKKTLKAQCTFQVSQSCTPKTCQVGQCGTIDDGCGGTRACGGCGAGKICNQNKCETCTPRECEPGQCGAIDDGCGGTRACGGCDAGMSCNKNQCETCRPRGCLAGQCGTVQDGCGGTMACGGCANGLSCTNNMCIDPSCKPRMCVAGVDCGVLPNGCGGTVDCGQCPGTSTNHCSRPVTCAMCGLDPNTCRPVAPRSPNNLMDVKGYTGSYYTCQEVYEMALGGRFENQCGIITAQARNLCNCPDNTVFPGQEPQTTPACKLCPNGVVDQGDGFHIFSIGALSCDEAYSYAARGFVPSSMCSLTKQEAVKFGCCAG